MRVRMSDQNYHYRRCVTHRAIYRLVRSMRSMQSVLILTMCAYFACEAPSASIECELNSDCPLPERCVMNICKLECVETRDCALDEVCQAGRCLSVGADEPPLSDPPNMMAPSMSCQLDTDCLSGSACTEGVCRAIEGFCEQNRDCLDNELCSREASRCVERETPRSCVDTGDCFAGEICFERICTAEGDFCPDGDCPMTCGADSDCDMGDICQEGLCTLGCRSDQECPGELLCRTGRCAPECAYNSDCIAPLICQEGQCIPECVEDRDCEMGEYCLKGACGVECVVNEDCDEYLICISGRCDPECTEERRCEGGLMCRDQRCQPECLVDSDCPDNLTCRAQICESECHPERECAEGLVCREGRCVPECMIDGDCAEGLACQDLRCVTPAAPYTGTFLISSSTPIRRCNDLLSINFEPRVAQTTQNAQGFTLFLPNPPTTYVGQLDGESFTVSWSGSNGNTEYCGGLTTSNTYAATFTSEDLFMGTLTVDFFFQVGACDCQIQWPVIGVRQ